MSNNFGVGLRFGFAKRDVGLSKNKYQLTDNLRDLAEQAELRGEVNMAQGAYNLADDLEQGRIGFAQAKRRFNL